jgi:flagella basal body P-ring formation protein FlgA
MAQPLLASLVVEANRLVAALRRRLALGQVLAQAQSQLKRRNLDLIKPKALARAARQMPLLTLRLLPLLRQALVLNLFSQASWPTPVRAT